MADIAEQPVRPNENNLFPPPKKQIRSAMWEHFGYTKEVIKDADSPFAKPADEQSRLRAPIH